MEPAGFRQSEFVPLQENKQDFFGEARGAPGLQYTTVAINSTEPPPKDYIVWSICSLVYFNPCCLGLAALYYSVKARDQKAAGDVEGSIKYGSRAGFFNKVSLLVGIILIIIIPLVLYINVKTLMHQFKETTHNNHNG